MSEAKISKIQLRNVLGIKELNCTPSDMNEIVGRTGSGKTSFLDALIIGLGNKNNRTEIIKTGTEEAEVLIELTDGTVVDRKKRLKKSDTIKVKGGDVITSPETHLRSLFDINQFDPIAFMGLGHKEQAKELLDLTHIEWTKEDFAKWFGEIPTDSEINYEHDHILMILDHLSSAKSQWYLQREIINRKVRELLAVKSDLLNSLPDGFRIDDWRSVDVGELYAELSKAIEHNSHIETNKSLIETSETKVAAFKLGYDKTVESIGTKVDIKKGQIEEAKRTLENDLTMADSWKANMIAQIEKEWESKKKDANTKAADTNARLTNEISSLIHEAGAAKAKMEKDIEVTEIQLKSATNFVESHELIPVDRLQNEADRAKEMCSYIKDYDKAADIEVEVNGLVLQSNHYTSNIKKARELPAELLEKSTMPITGMSMQDGTVRINGLPIENLSTGEKLQLTVDIAVQKTGDLKVIFVDKLESLDTATREKFIEKCRQTGLQFFLTRVTDDEFEVREV